MQKLMLFLLLSSLLACATKPVANTAIFAKTSASEDQKLEKYPLLSAEYELAGFKIKKSDCTFLRTLYLDLSPEQSPSFLNKLKSHIEPKTIMGLDAKKSLHNPNPCSRVRLFTTLAQIREQGSKKLFDEKGWLTKATLGVAPKGQVYLHITHFEKRKNVPVRIAGPGYFLSYQQAEDMTDDELAEWIVSTVYRVGWK